MTACCFSANGSLVRQNACDERTLDEQSLADDNMSCFLADGDSMTTIKSSLIFAVDFDNRQSMVEKDIINNADESEPATAVLALRDRRDSQLRSRSSSTLNNEHHPAVKRDQSTHVNY